MAAQYQMMPTVEAETILQAQGYRAIAGIDEAGRGCWAGPVVAAAVVLGQDVLDRPELLTGVTDSKQLRPVQRAALEQTIFRHVAGVGVGVVPAHLIDWFGIVDATQLAMELAILHLPLLPDALLIDALLLPRCPLPQQSIIRGDSASLSIAAASVIAKTARDRLMTNFDRSYPAFRFGLHKGYGTALHARAIVEHGVTPLHRRSFRPLWHISEKEHTDAA